jgi:hypothetical protein
MGWENAGRRRGDGEPRDIPAVLAGVCDVRGAA